MCSEIICIRHLSSHWISRNRTFKTKWLGKLRHVILVTILGSTMSPTSVFLAIYENRYGGWFSIWIALFICSQLWNFKHMNFLLIIPFLLKRDSKVMPGNDTVKSYQHASSWKRYLERSLSWKALCWRVLSKFLLKHGKSLSWKFFRHIKFSNFMIFPTNL